MLPFPGNGIRKLIGLLPVLSSGIVSSIADPPAQQPVLTIGFTKESSSAITVSPLAWASVPVLVDVRTATVFVRSGGTTNLILTAEVIIQAITIPGPVVSPGLGQASRP